MSWFNIREENLNIMLAELLAESGLKAIGEVIVKRVKFEKRKMPDILLDINGIRIIIEGKFPGQRKELIEEAKKRLESGVCDIVVMVEYSGFKMPSKLNVTQLDIKEALKESRFNIGFMTYVEQTGLDQWLNIPIKKDVRFYENADFSDLVAHLLATYDFVVKENIIEPVIEALEKSIFDYAEKVKQTGINIERLKKVLELTGDMSAENK